MKVAVSGASGFIGRHVVAELARRQVQTTLLVRRAESVAAGPGQCAVEFDLLQEPGDVFERAGRPDVLLHLAWGGLPNYRSLHHFEQELPAQYRFLSKLVRGGLKNLLVVGTCFEYGMQSGPLSEDLPARPDNPYGYAKDSLRRQLELLRAAQPFKLTWARLFYLHGEGQAASSLLPLLRQAVARGDKVFNMSGGEQLRDYLPVTEVALKLVALALQPADHGVLNLCSGQPVSVRSLVEGWIAENNWAIELELGHLPYPDHEPMAFWGDRRKLDAVLGTN